MKRFGFGKKDKATPPPPAQESAFKPPPPQQPSNPYSQAPPPPSNNSGGYGGGGGGYGGGYGGYGSEKKVQQDDDADRGALFGNKTRPKSPAPSYHSQAPSYSSGGGGYGAAPSDPNRGALFGNKARQPAPPSGGYGAPTGGYGAPPPERREGMSPEEEEEEDVDAIKQQIRFTKQESVNSTRRALAAAASAEETGRNTLCRLGAQGERLTNTKKNLDLAHNQNRKAEETTRELQTLNRSMFAVHVSNPFNSAKRAQGKEDEIIANHQAEMEERERARQAGYESRKIVNEGLGGGKGVYGGYGKSGLSGGERTRYQFEADESDDEKEKEIEHNLDQLGNVTGRLKNLGIAMNKELDRQDKQLTELHDKTSAVELGITRNTHKLRQIK